MALELTELLQQALAAHPDDPLCVLDPRTHKTYVLIREDVFKQLQGLPYNDSDLDIRDAYPLMDSVSAKEGWDSPEMDSYNKVVPGSQS